jgi:hypothetical protein
MICLRFFVFFEACHPGFLKGLWMCAMLVTGSAGGVCSVAVVAPLVEFVGDPVIDDVIDDAPVFISSSSSSYVFNRRNCVNCLRIARFVRGLLLFFYPHVVSAGPSSRWCLIFHTLPLRPNLTLVCFPLATLLTKHQWTHKRNQSLPMWWFAMRRCHSMRTVVSAAPGSLLSCEFLVLVLCPCVAPYMAWMCVGAVLMRRWVWVQCRREGKPSSCVAVA